MGGQEAIVKLGDRRHSGFCLGCGTTLIQPANDYQCCSECTGEIEHALGKLEHKRKMAKDGKVGGMQVLDKRNILRQAVPMGIPVK